MKSTAICELILIVVQATIRIAIRDLGPSTEQKIVMEWIYVNLEMQGKIRGESVWFCTRKIMTHKSEFMEE